jgi:hypothetical protein
VACPFGQLVITTYPLLPTPILSVPFGKAHDDVLLGICALCESTERLARGASIPAANSLYQGEAPMPFSRQPSVHCT